MHAHFSLVVGSVQRARFVTFETGEGAQAAIGASPILDEGLLGDSAGRIDGSESAVPVPTLHIE